MAAHLGQIPSKEKKKKKKKKTQQDFSLALHSHRCNLYSLLPL